MRLLGNYRIYEIDVSLSANGYFETYMVNKNFAMNTYIPYNNPNRILFDYKIKLNNKTTVIYTWYNCVFIQRININRYIRKLIRYIITYKNNKLCVELCL